MDAYETFQGYRTCRKSDGQAVQLCSDSEQRGYLALDPDSGRLVAVHVLNPDRMEDEEIRALAFDRLRRLRSFRHPSLPAILDHGETDGVVYYVTAFRDTENLWSYAERAGRLPPHLALEIISGILESLSGFETDADLLSCIQVKNASIALRGESGPEFFAGSFTLSHETRPDVERETSLLVGPILELLHFLLTGSREDIAMRIAARKIEDLPAPVRCLVQEFGSQMSSGAAATISSLVRAGKSQWAAALHRQPPNGPLPLLSSGALRELLPNDQSLARGLATSYEFTGPNEMQSSVYSYCLKGAEDGKEFSLLLLPPPSLIGLDKLKLPQPGQRQKEESYRRHTVGIARLIEDSRVICVIEEQVNGFSLETLLSRRRSLGTGSAYILLRALDEACSRVESEDRPLPLHARDVLVEFDAGSCNENIAQLLDTIPVGDWPDFIIRIRLHATTESLFDSDEQKAGTFSSLAARLLRNEGSESMAAARGRGEPSAPESKQPEIPESRAELLEQISCQLWKDRSLQQGWQPSQSQPQPGQFGSENGSASRSPQSGDPVSEEHWLDPSQAGPPDSPGGNPGTGAGLAAAREKNHTADLAAETGSSRSGWMERFFGLGKRSPELVDSPESNGTSDDHPDTEHPGSGDLELPPTSPFASLGMIRADSTEEQIRPEAATQDKTRPEEEGSEMESPFVLKDAAPGSPFQPISTSLHRNPLEQSDAHQDTALQAPEVPLPESNIEVTSESLDEIRLRLDTERAEADAQTEADDLSNRPEETEFDGALNAKSTETETEPEDRGPLLPNLPFAQPSNDQAQEINAENLLASPKSERSGADDKESSQEQKQARRAVSIVLAAAVLVTGLAYFFHQLESAPEDTARVSKGIGAESPRPAGSPPVGPGPKSNPDDEAEVQRKLANLDELIKTRHWKSAFQTLASVVESLGPDAPGLRVRLDALLQQREQNREAFPLQPAMLEVLESFAGSKHLNSTIALGDHYRKIDPRTAEIWYLSALQQNDQCARAMVALGTLYASGDLPGGNSEDESKTIGHWFAKAEALDSGEGLYLIGMALIRGEGVKANAVAGLSKLEKSATMAFAPALFQLGECHYQGLATRRDYKKALAIFELAENNDEIAALGSLGLMHMKGQGVTQNKERGVDYFNRGAERGDPRCMYYYAVCLEDGEGVEQNWEASRTWFIRAALAGNSSAIDWCDKNDVPLEKVELSDRS